MASTTPIVDPPIVRNGEDARLLIHEDALEAIIKGFRSAKPQLFVFGSFDLPQFGKPANPLRIPTPNGGADLVLNYRVDLREVLVDFNWAGKTLNGFANPFALSANEGALGVRIFIDVAGDPTTAWRESIGLTAWLKCSFSLSNNVLVLQLQEVQVLVDQAANSALVQILNRVLNDYLKAAAMKYYFPLADFLKTDLFSAQVSSVLIDLNAVDASTKISF